MTERPESAGANHSRGIVHWVRGTLTGLVAIVMFTMMAVTTADVTGRALLSIPIKGSDEIVSFLLAILIFASLPLITWDERHITVRLFDRWIVGRVHRALDVLLSVIGTIVVGVVSYRMWIQGLLMSQGQHITGALEWPIAPVVFLMSGLGAFTTLVLISLTWQKMTGGNSPHLSASGVEDEGSG